MIRSLLLTSACHTGTHDWNKYITPDEMRSMIEQRGADENAGCEVRKICGLVVRPPSPSSLIASLMSGRRTASSALFKSWVVSETDTDVNYIVHAVKM